MVLYKIIKLVNKHLKIEGKIDCWITIIEFLAIVGAITTTIIITIITLSIVINSLKLLTQWWKSTIIITSIIIINLIYK